MNTTKATYWIALATFALALNSKYQHGGFPALHRVGERAGTTLCRISARAEQTLAMVRVLTARPELPAEDLLASNAAEMAENQAEMLRGASLGRSGGFPGTGPRQGRIATGSGSRSGRDHACPGAVATRSD
jgi:hypothetical protein